MNVQQEAVALWRFFESRGFRPSVRSISRALRDQGLRFRESSLREHLSKFADASRTRADAKTEHAGRSGTEPGRDFARTVIVSQVSSDVEKSSSSQPAGRQQKLRLVDPVEIEARQILLAVWPLVAERVGSAMTQTAWRRRNKAIALDFASAGVPVERVVKAHAELSRQRGDVVYTLSWVQDFLTRTAPPKAIPISKSGADERPQWLKAAIDRGNIDRRHAAGER